MTITITNEKNRTQTIELTNEQFCKLKDVFGINTKCLSDVPIGETFMVDDIEFIHFGNGVAVTKDIWCEDKFDKDTNNLKASSILKKLEKEFLLKIIKAVGKDNVCEFETDLIALDGLKDYGVIKSKVSLPTYDFYKKNIEVFDRYKLNSWWWLATPWSTPTHGYSSTVCCVSFDGTVDDGDCGYGDGVRPFCIFESSIFVS